MKEKVQIFIMATIAAFMVYATHQFLASHIQCAIQ